MNTTRIYIENNSVIFLAVLYMLRIYTVHQSKYVQQKTPDPIAKTPRCCPISGTKLAIPS
jgi:hypothetical protein